MTSISFNRLRNLKLLLSVEGIGPGRIRTLLSTFHSFENILSADYDALIQIHGINSKLASLIKNANHKKDEVEAALEIELKILQKVGGSILTVWDKDYPPLLKKIFDPPLLLYVKGEFQEPDYSPIAVVGTRVPSNYGKIQCEKITSQLIAQNVTIISGLARGIDSIAHNTSIKEGGRTIAVIGSGLDVIYPPENKKLFTQISESGAVISEYPPGTQPDAQNFPRRNRIISGLSLGTLIIETDLMGGAMQTAALALDQNREVFAIPGPLDIKQSKGTNRLIQKGEAKLIKDADDILIELETYFKSAVKHKTEKPKQNLNIFEEKIIDVLQENQVQIDDISSLTNIPVSDCLVNLLSLEFKGMIKQLPGKVFAKL